MRRRYERVRERLTPKRVHAPSLDALNFLVADVRGALGPYITVFLVADQHWAVATVGWVNTLGGWLGLAMQTPLGALLDATSKKRRLLLMALIVLGAGATIVSLLPSFWPVLIANACMQVVSGIFEPAIAALTVGLFGRAMLTRRMGRNAAFASAGNLTVAALAAVLGWLFAPRAVFFQVPFTALAACVVALTVPHHAIDDRRARGLKSGDNEKGAPASLSALFSSRALVVFGVSSLLFNLANAPLLTLVSQKLAVTGRGSSSLMTSACIMAAEAGMLPAALLIGRKADKWGHRRLLLVAFAVPAVQAVLTTLNTATPWLIGLQFIGGFGTGLLTAVTPLLLADATNGTGRYNVSQGMIVTLRSLGAASSGLVSEFLVDQFNYDVAFLTFGIIAFIGLALVWFGMPETRELSTTPQPNT